MREVRQRSVALILARELAVNLVTPILIWDQEGELVYFNEPAQAIIGRSFTDMSDFSVDKLPDFRAEDLDGNPIELPQFASSVALSEKRPAHRMMRIVGLDGIQRDIEVTAFPLLTRGNEFVGAAAIFWERGAE